MVNQNGGNSILGLSARPTHDPCATPSATATSTPGTTPTSTPTPTQGVVQLPATGQGDVGSSSNGARAVLLAVAGIVMLATALIAARRRPA